MKDKILERVLSLKARLQFSEKSVEVADRVATRLINKLELTENPAEHYRMLVNKMEKEADRAAELPEMDRDYTLAFLILIAETLKYEKENS